MNYHTTIEQLRGMRLDGMAQALGQQMSDSVYLSLSFEQRVQMFVEAETSHRDTARYDRILKLARLKITAAPEDIEYGAARNLDKLAVQAARKGLTVAYRRVAHLLEEEWPSAMKTALSPVSAATC